MKFSVTPDEIVDFLRSKVELVPLPAMPEAPTLPPLQTKVSSPQLQTQPSGGASSSQAQPHSPSNEEPPHSPSAITASPNCSEEEMQRIGGSPIVLQVCRNDLEIRQKINNSIILH